MMNWKKAKKEEAQLKAEYDKVINDLRQANDDNEIARGEFLARKNKLYEVRKHIDTRQKQLVEYDTQSAKKEVLVEQLQARLKEVENNIAEIDLSLTLFNKKDDIKKQKEIDKRREDVLEKRSALASEQAILESFVLLRRQRIGDLERLADDIGRCEQRREQAHKKIALLEQRVKEATQEAEEVAKKPIVIKGEKEKVASLLSQAEVRRKRLGVALLRAETRLQDSDKQTNSARQLLAQAREERAALKATLDASEQRVTDNEKMIYDKLSCAPQKALAMSQYQNRQECPPKEEAEKLIADLKREREMLGAVNLRAEEEAKEKATQLKEKTAESEDLTKAIKKLRLAIGRLNREGRQRLLAAFDDVNNHFGALFKQLFGGGSAELRLTDSEDPLQAGLELYAHPPGKKPQHMSLLSGGEQALTALALIFAVFSTNPSPICVLDEVDAPLDDANVERFCHMIEDIVRTTKTRFLIITHHAFTMARVDRLFGVIMQERGVSELISVDLKTARQFAQKPAEIKIAS